MYEMLRDKGFLLHNRLCPWQPVLALRRQSETIKEIMVETDGMQHSLLTA